MMTSTSPALTAADRCDRCGAQAYAAYEPVPGLTLLLCAHHKRENHDALIAKGATLLTDNTDSLKGA